MIEAGSHTDDCSMSTDFTTCLQCLQKHNGKNLMNAGLMLAAD